MEFFCYFLWGLLYEVIELILMELSCFSWCLFNFSLVMLRVAGLSTFPGLYFGSFGGNFIGILYGTINVAWI